LFGGGFYDGIEGFLGSLNYFEASESSRKSINIAIEI
jgi:hypothetical protein